MKKILFFVVSISFLFTLSASGTFGSDPPPGGNPPGATTHAVKFENPLKFDTVEDILTSLLNSLRGVIVVISLVFIVIGAILYITSAGSEERIKSAKKAITASMIGLAIGIAAPSFLKEIATILGWTSQVTDPSGQNILTIKQIALNTLEFLLGIVGIFAIIMLVVGGISYFGAGLNEKQAESSKKIIWFSVLGILVAMAALVIVKQIAAFFGVS